MGNYRKARNQDAQTKISVNWLTGNMKVENIDAMFQSKKIKDILEDSKVIQEALRRQNAAVCGLRNVLQPEL